MQKTLKDYIPKQALEEVVKVLKFGEKKHGNSWLGSSITLHINHALKHINSGLYKSPEDEETHLSNFAHAICRLLFALSVEIELEKEVKKCLRTEKNAKNVD